MRVNIKFFKFLTAILFLSFIATGCSTSNQLNNNKEEQKQTIASSTNESANGSNLLASSTKEKIKSNSIKDNADEKKYYKVVKVIDGDTIDVDINGKTERIRMIGVNTPETVDPRKPVECFGKEASNKAKEWLNGQEVKLEADETQTDQDKYSRLLRYVWRKDGFFYNLEIIKQGYAYEYTFDLPYRYQKDFKSAQGDAKTKKLGLWAENACTKAENTQNEAAKTPSANIQTIPQPSAQITTQNQNTQANNSSCLIKGNISTKKEKIYHVPGCGSYSKTVIDTDAGERWFCTEAEAVSAGWRKAENCP